MAKEITKNNTSFRNNNPQSLDTGQLEYVGSKIFWSAALGLGAITIYASLVYLVVQQLRK